ncbi:hypothetical protein LC612_40415 [Nostoc sp. CHAB 5834]|nr:hypothetical protein [Nostoc sp. CHAB 5834]
MAQDDLDQFSALLLPGLLELLTLVEPLAFLLIMLHLFESFHVLMLGLLIR